MPITPVVGPAGGGKSQYIAANIRPGWVIVDFTALFVGLTGVQRGADGKYPERVTGDPILPMTSALKAVALSMAVEREMDGFVTTSNRDDVPTLERITGTAAVVVDPGEAVIRARLADAVTGQLSQECNAAFSRWFR